ncbi:MAG: HepT-like ribonuclease domain-containing protein [Acidimicrobiales bacterium]
MLARIEDLVALGRDRFDSDDLVRLAVERLWIYAGNLALDRCDDSAVPAGIGPWSELIALRHVYAHYLPDQINPARVWADTEGDVSRIRAEVATAAESG